MRNGLKNILGGCTAVFALTLMSTAPVAAQDRLIIATYGGEYAELWRSAVAEPFQKETGIKTEIFESPHPPAAVDSAAGSPQFDLAIVGGYNTQRYSQAGSIVELTPEEIPNLKYVPENLWVRGPDGRLLGVTVNFEYLGIAYNTNEAKAEDFSSWENLLDPKWKDKVSLAPPSALAAYDVNLFAHLRGGDENNIEPGLKMLSQLFKNALTFYSSMSALEAQIGRGEIVAAPFYSGNVVLLRNAGVKNIDMVIPDEGGLLLPYLLVIPKGAKNVEGAKKLLNAILSADYQLRLAKSGAWPSNGGVKLTPELEALLGGTLDIAIKKNYSPNWYVVGEKYAERTRLIEAELEKSK